MSAGITLGHVLLVSAAVELLFVLVAGLSVLRANPDASPEQRRRVYLIIAAGIVTAAVLCLLAVFWPDARMRLT
jgi:hypothetical protein